MNYLLAGNPNSGKTTLFNRLTKTHAKVGNYAGVSVEVKSGKYFADKKITIFDLPGAYSLTAISLDEKVAVSKLKEGGAKGIIAVLDGTRLARSLPFARELLSLGLPVTFAVNFCDELSKSGIVLDTKKLSKILGCPVVEISAKKGLGVQKLMLTVLSNTTIPVSTKPLNIVVDDLFLSKKEQTVSEKFTVVADKVLLGKYTAVFCLAIILFLTFYISTTVGGFFGEKLSALFAKITIVVRSYLTKLSVSKIATSLLVDGVLSSVMEVLSFLPQVVITFFFLSLYEFTGYASRIAFLTDGFLSKVGMSGKATFSLLSSLGCGVNGVLATRIIDDKSQRSRTILLTPLLPCGAKIAVMLWVAQRYFSNPALVSVFAVLTTFSIVFLSGFILKRFGVYGEDNGDFVMELPTYRAPSLASIFAVLKEKVMNFIKKAGTVIVLVSILIWFLSSFSFSLEYGEKNSIIFTLGSLFGIFLKPLGFLGEDFGVALLCGVFAREGIIPALALSTGEFANGFSAFGFIVFINLYTPCFSALSTMKKEFSSKKDFRLAVFLQFLIAYSTALFINFIGILYGFCAILPLIFIATIIFLTILLRFTIIAKNRSKNQAILK